jgi:hypothetical protein
MRGASMQRHTHCMRCSMVALPPFPPRAEHIRTCPPCTAPYTAHFPPATARGPMAFGLRLVRHFFLSFFPCYNPHLPPHLPQPSPASPPACPCSCRGAPGPADQQLLAAGHPAAHQVHPGPARHGQQEQARPVPAPRCGQHPATGLPGCPVLLPGSVPAPGGPGGGRAGLSRCAGRRRFEQQAVEGDC